MARLFQLPSGCIAQIISAANIIIIALRFAQGIKAL
jgi:hypothetical protein